MKSSRPFITNLAAALVLVIFAGECSARTVLRNICRVKGQEENTLQGIGLVVGLAGTGEAADARTMQALSRALELMGAPPSELLIPGKGKNDLDKVKNVAMVIVTARVPATGARRGDRLDCQVSGVNGKSLAGGRLVFTTLRGPNPTDTRIYATCEGGIHLSDPEAPLTGVIAGGCQMQEDVMTSYINNEGCITLVLEENHANFATATEVVESIHKLFTREDEGFVKAINASNIIVRIPGEYRENPVAFVADVLDVDIYTAEPEARVVINERTGSIVISGDVTIGDVVVSHKNVVIEAGQAPTFEAIDTDQSDSAKLDALVDALNSIKVPNEDRIAIIKTIARSGKLHGRLIVE
jgi:flagellar P-ring protein precursor FlgI